MDKIMAYGGDFIDRFTLPRYDKVVVLTEEDRITHWSNCRNVVVIPNPIRSSFEGVSPLIHKKVITAGRLTAQKNHHSLIKAFSRVVKSHPDWTLDIYGEGPLKGMLEQEIKQLDLENHVHLCGFTSNLPSVYVKSSMFVLSSIYEGLPLVAIEAMSSGLPVVSYACPCGPRDIITDGKDGFLVPVNDEKQLADRICYLIEHEEERKQMGQTALEKSRQYSLDKIMARWRDLFNTLVNERC
jgi:glycosyltransferase involved in cell wall biosynthesis